MKSSKYSDCSKCPLIDQGRCIGETNCKNNLSDVDVLILAEAPASEEIKQNRPLVGRAGRIFRQAFQLSGLEKQNYMISNVVLCSNIIDGKTNNPPKEAVDCCKPNWEALIKILQPKVILLMGSIPMQALNIAEGSITKIRGNFYDYNNIPVMVTVHPSYVMRQGGELKSEVGQWFYEDMKKVVKLISKVDIYDEEEENYNTENTDNNVSEEYYETEQFIDNKKIIDDLTKPYSFSLPNWCYEKDVELFDVQYIYSEKTILYIFLTPEGKKYYKIEGSDNYYYIDPRQLEIEDAPMISPVEKTQLVLGSPPNSIEMATFESDIKPEIKRVIDYRYNRKNEEPNYPMKKMFADIEVYNNRSRRFPNPKKANSPINAISFKIDDGPVNVWVCRLPQMDSKEFTIPEGVLYKSYATEYNLLQAFAKLVSKENPSILCGWNFLGFDMLTIYGRMVKLGVDPNLMSPVGSTFFDLKRYGRVFVFGMHVLDMLDLYKELTYSVEESYKLDYIAQKQIKCGKVSYDGTLDELYEENLGEFVRYSAVDTDLLYKLDIKMGHLNLKKELIKICSTTWKSAESTMGLVDPLCVSYAKEQNLVCRNAIIKSSDKRIPGAYVRNPIGGRHNYVIDLDFASLYPSIICSCNIGPNTYIAKIEPHIANDIIYNREKLDLDQEIDITLSPINKNCVKRKTTIRQLIKTLDTRKSIITAAGTIYKNHNDELSFLNKILTYLLNSRKQYKDSMKDAKRGGDETLFNRIYNIQLAYKILANAIYGVLANHAFRLFNLDLAMSITLTGQEIVKFSGWHLSQYMQKEITDINPDFSVGYEDNYIKYILYQDTDSIFVALGDYLTDKGILQ